MVTCSRAVVALAVLVATSGVASAQIFGGQNPPRPERPYRGLFGGGAAQTNTDQSLVAGLSLGGGVTDGLVGDEAAQQTAPIVPSTRRSSAFGSASGNVSYSLSRTRVATDLAFGASARYFDQAPPNLFVASNGHAGVSWQVAKRTSVSVRSGATYQPYTLYLFSQVQLDPNVPPNVTSAATDERYFSWDANVSVDQGITQRVSFYADASYRRSELFAGDRQTHQGARGGFSVAVGRGLGLRLGYGYYDVEGRLAGGVTRYRNQVIDAGLDFSRSLSLTRKTTLGFSTGAAGSQEPNRNFTRWSLTGHVRLNRDIGRTWNTSLAYGRTLEFNELIVQPIFTDRLGWELAGLISRRVDLRLSASTSKGTMSGGLGASDDLKRSHGGATLTTAFTRHVALSLSYSISSYDFGTAVTLPIGIQRELTYQSVHAALRLWAPIFTRTRRP